MGFFGIIKRKEKELVKMNFLKQLLDQFNSDPKAKMIYTVEGVDENGDSIIYAVCDSSNLAFKIEQKLISDSNFDGIAIRTYSREVYKESYLN